MMQQNSIYSGQNKASNDHANNSMIKVCPYVDGKMSTSMTKLSTLDIDLKENERT